MQNCSHNAGLEHLSYFHESPVSFGFGSQRRLESILVDAEEGTQAGGGGGHVALDRVVFLAAVQAVHELEFSAWGVALHQRPLIDTSQKRIPHRQVPRKKPNIKSCEDQFAGYPKP